MTGAGDGYDVSTYGERVARVYDEIHEDALSRDTAEAVAFLLEAADGGPVLELGVGTGRIALPLVDAGLRVHGIDSSPAMVAAMRRKRGGRRVRVTIGDFEHVGAEGRFRLVFVAFNTFFGLLSQDAQVRCFANVARQLEPGGAFVIQAFVPDPARFDGDQRTATMRVDAGGLDLEATVHDRIEQRIVSQHVRLREGAVELLPVQLRYAFPSELDLMARLAGMRLRERWSGWRCEPFDAESRRHVSVYELGPSTRRRGGPAARRRRSS